MNGSVVGTPFYLMDFVKGRIFKDPVLQELRPEERYSVCEAMCDVLCKIHSVDLEKAQLTNYGKPGR